MKSSQHAFVSSLSPSLVSFPSPLHGSQTQSQQFHVVSNGFDFANDAFKESFFPNAPSWLIGSSTELEPLQTFEPQVDMQALFSFAVIAIMFTLLQIRINSVRDASLRREEALTFLRQVKSEQLDSSMKSKTDSSNEQTLSKEKANDNNDKVKNAIKAYEKALKEELDLRTIIPGVRIVAPNDASRREEDIAAAKQFLDWDINILDADEKQEDSSGDKMNKNKGNEEGTVSLDNVENDSKAKQLRQMERNKQLMQSRRRFDGEDGDSPALAKSEDQPMSNGAKAILLTVALSQIALLFFLSLDPMSANNVFTEIAGNPPDNIPPSSW